jgi:Protein of unknown function (DUF3489)
MKTNSTSKPSNSSASVIDTSAASGVRLLPTKTDQLVASLQTPHGISIEELSDRFGWMPHSTRAALTGVRKKGHVIVREKQGSVTVYRIGE